METKILILFHILGATIFAGNVFVLTFGILPKARKAGDLSPLTNYLGTLSWFGRIGLLLQFLTGFRLAQLLLPMGEWFAFDNTYSHDIMTKLILWLIVGALIEITGGKIKKGAELKTITRLTYILCLVTFGLLYFGTSLRVGGF